MTGTPDYPRFFEGLNTLVDKVNLGDSGLPALYHLMELGQRAVGAAGMSFAEYVPAGGRVIVATGASQWALGRPVDTTDPTVVQLLAGLRAQERVVDDLPEEMATHLRGRGLRRMIGARAELRGTAVGSVHAYFCDPPGPSSAAQLSVVTFLATAAAHLYGERGGLPVHGDAPVVATPVDGLAIVGEDGAVRLWNPAAERATGIPATEALGQLLPFPVPEQGQTLDHRLPDGRCVQVFAGDLPGSGASVITFRDVTEIRRRERDRDLFIAVTSHELRTPVTVIKGFADTLGEHWDSLDDAARRDAVRVLGQRAGDLARLVDRLLSASSHTQVSVGATTPVPFDLVDALRTAAESLPTEMRWALRMELPVSLPKAFGERSSIPTVLTELVTNAGKYSPDGPNVCVSAGSDEATVFFRVADRGVGIRPDHVERAFERFWQGESDDHRRYGGVGLGLYLVRRIVERQNGWVSLRPRERGGTVAEVRLPRADAAPGEA